MKQDLKIQCPHCLEELIIRADTDKASVSISECHHCRNRFMLEQTWTATVNLYRVEKEARSTAFQKA